MPGSTPFGTMKSPICAGQKSAARHGYACAVRTPDHAAPLPGVTSARIDPTRPHSARMYDYFLGGKDHFAVDRETAEAAMKSWPAVRTAVRENRAFLGRTVRYLAEEGGIRQFLDIGTGLPSANNVHEVAQHVAPESRIVYVDNDPIVLAHARSLLRGTPQGRTAYIDADLREPDRILSDPVLTATIDLTRPVALMLVAILHFLVDDDDPAGIVRTLAGALAPGSYLVASHVSPEHDPVGVRGLERTYRQSGVQAQVRTAAEFSTLAFAGLRLVEPGVVLVSEWRPNHQGPRPPAETVNWYGGVAIKPGGP
jgi:SAM-dependent methyltransferase